MYDGEILKTKDGTYRRECARALDKYIVGCDVGQSQDASAIAVVHHSTRALETWTPHHPKSQNYTGRLVQNVKQCFDLRALERIPLGTPYPEQVRRVEQIMAHPRPRDADLLVDATGVGSAIADMFETISLQPIRITITAGHEATRHSDERFSVPKIDVVSAVLAKLHSQGLRFDEKLALLEPLREELKNFQLLGRSPTGFETFGARSGTHDDLVLALGLAMWWATSAAKVRRHGEVTECFVRGL
jgi:hypothetical protein